MIDEVRTAAVSRPSSARLDATTERAGFGVALGAAIGLRSESAEAHPEASPQIDRQGEPQQTDKTIKARRAFDKRGQGPVTAATPAAPNRPRETIGDRSGSTAQAGDQSGQQRLATGEERSVQHGGRRLDLSAAIPARDATNRITARAELSDMAPQTQPKEKSETAQEAPAPAPVPGLQGQAMPDQTLHQHQLTLVDHATTQNLLTAQPGMLAVTPNRALQTEDAADEPLQAARTSVATGGRIPEPAGNPPERRATVVGQALSPPLIESAFGDRMSAQNRLPAGPHWNEAIPVPAPQTSEAAQVSITEAQARTQAPAPSTTAFAAQPLEARPRADEKGILPHPPEPTLSDRMSAQNRLPAGPHWNEAIPVPAPQTSEAAQVSITEAQARTQAPAPSTTAFAAQPLEARPRADGQTASPLRLAIDGSEARDVIATATTQAPSPASDAARASLDPKHAPRDTPPQPAMLGWRPQSAVAEAALPSSTGDGKAVLRLLDAINGMRQTTASAPPSEPGGSSFAASLANAAASSPSPQPADAAAIPLANPWPLQDPEFQTHLAGQVGEALMAGLERAEITVSPRELGPIKIELALSGENASVAFSAAHPDTREAIERSLPTLETMLAEHGLTLSHSSVSDSAQQSAGRQPDRGSPDRVAPIGAEQSGGRLPVISVSPRPVQAARGLLDLFA